MIEEMNILYVIGNGFDKAQGMETGYPEFYKYLIGNSEDASPLLQQVKKEINSDIEKWSDMEVALCAFTKSLKDVSEFEDMYYELREHLEIYLRKQEEKFSPTEKHKETILQHFLHPEQFIYETEREQSRKVFANKKDYCHYNVMMFNYTNTFEKLIGDNREWKFRDGIKRKLFDVCYLHGKLGDNIIIGADRIEQIANEEFRKSDEIEDFLIKINANESLMRNRHSICEGYIKEADVIVFFGVSFGETDQRWWDLIGSEMRRRGNLGIVDFEYKHQKPHTNRPKYSKRVVDDCKKMLCDKMGITRDVAEGRLFVVVNSSMFNYNPVD